MTPLQLVKKFITKLEELIKMHIMRHQLTSLWDHQVQGQKNTFFMSCRNSGTCVFLVLNMHLYLVGKFNEGVFPPTMC
jgi:hypothetical protein